MTAPLDDEPLLALGALSRRLPGRGDAPSVSPRTLSRWITRGARAATGERVYLEAVRAPGGWLSSAEALNRFLAALATPRPGTSPPTRRSPAARTQASEAAAAELERLKA